MPLTIRECCEKAARELGWSEEQISQAQRFCEAFIPGEGSRMIPEGATERETIDRLKEQFESFDKMPEPQKGVFAKEVFERVQKSSIRN